MADSNSETGAGRTVLGAVLCGGRSRRFGGGKETALLRGRPLVTYAVAAATQAGLSVALVGGDPDLARRLDLVHVPDAEGLAGPVAGLVAALRHAGGRGHAGVVLLGADMPLVPPALVAAVAESGLAGDAGAVALESPAGRLQPLGAFYATSSLDAVSEHASEPGASLRSAFAAAGGTHLQPADAGLSDMDLELAFTNVNTVADLAAAEAHLN